MNSVQVEDSCDGWASLAESVASMRENGNSFLLKLLESKLFTSKGILAYDGILTCFSWIFRSFEC